jgi:type VI protein secretion system component Hcp
VEVCVIRVDSQREIDGDDDAREHQGRSEAEAHTRNMSKAMSKQTAEEALSDLLTARCYLINE